MIIYGKPGEYAQGLANNLRLKQGLYNAGIVVIGLGSVYALLTYKLPLYYLAPVVVVLIVLAVVSKNTRLAYRRAKIGADKETAVVKQLIASKLNATVYCGLMLGAGGDCDLIVVLEHFLAAVEVKTGFGNVFVSKTGGIIAGKRQIPGDPVAQILRQRSALEKQYPYNSTVPVVCISDGTVPPKLTSGSVHITNAVTLPQLLKIMVTTKTPVDTTYLDKLAKAQHKRKRTV